MSQTLKIVQHYRQINGPIKGYSNNLYYFFQVEKMTKVSFKFESYIIRCLVRIWSTWNTDTCKVRSKVHLTERNLKEFNHCLHHICMEKDKLV